MDKKETKLTPKQEMKVTKAKIKDVKVNPNNPRLIKDDKFKKLVQSIKEFPEMLDIRHIVVNKDMVILGGNMRYKACVEAGLKEVPIIIADLTDEQQREFLIKDNVSGGEWDFDMLANEWEVKQLEEWGLDLPIFDNESKESEEKEENTNGWFLNINFETEKDCQKWYEKLINEGLNCKIIV